MRLIHTQTRKLKEFFDSDVPQYAILSHRWGSVDDEVLHADYEKGGKEHRPGFRKINNFCDVAAELDFEWVWVDTCCIDKSSSAELSEAINSMFAWYKASQLCVVRLEDVSDAGDLKSFEKSSWFKRGWTLQELLAPSAVTFYTRDWKVIGKKDSPALAQRISKVTGIPQRVLKQPEILHRISVARRMSWAAGRQTSRLEDIAYCLLGIFDIHMPLVYGEGQKAFYRLQTQIMDQVEDESLFAWQGRASTRQWELHGLLAKSPSNFASCGNIVMTQTLSKLQSPPIRMTSRGAEVFAELSETDATTHDGSSIFLYTLGCATAPDNSAYLDVQIGTDVLRQSQLKSCSIAITRKAEREPFCRTDAGKSPSDLTSVYKGIGYVRPEQFYIRTAWSQIAAFAKVYDTGIGRTKSLLRPTRIAKLPSKPRPMSSLASFEPYGTVLHLPATSATAALEEDFPLVPATSAETTLVEDEFLVVTNASAQSAVNHSRPLSLLQSRITEDSLEEELPRLPSSSAESPIEEEPPCLRGSSFKAPIEEDFATFPPPPASPRAALRPHVVHGVSGRHRTQKWNIAKDIEYYNDGLLDEPSENYRVNNHQVLSSEAKLERNRPLTPSTAASGPTDQVVVDPIEQPNGIQDMIARRKSKKRRKPKRKAN